MPTGFQRILIALLFVASPLMVTVSSAGEVDVYLLGGQSNMQGIAKVENIPAEVPREIPRTFFYNGRSFEPFVIGETKSSTREGEFGPEVGFAIETANAERAIYLIKYSASGMPLHHGWDGSKWLGGKPDSARRNFYPGQDSSDKIQGTLYRQMLDRYRKGVRQVLEQGHQPILRGLVWMQGEQDAKQRESAMAYAANLKRLRRRLQKDLNGADLNQADLNVGQPLAIVYGQVLPYEPAAVRFTHRNEIREQMKLADSNLGDSASGETTLGESVRMAKASMVATDGFGLLPDTVHFNAEGQLRLGREFGKAMKRLQDRR